MIDVQPCLTAAQPGWRIAVAPRDPGVPIDVCPIVAWALVPDAGYAGGFRPCAVVARAFNYRDAPDYLELVDDDERFVVYLALGVTPESIELDEILRDAEQPVA